MARKLSKEQMIQAVEDGKYYVTYYSDTEEYTLCGMRKDGSFNGSEVKITDERAKEWLEVGIDYSIM